MESTTGISTLLQGWWGGGERLDTIAGKQYGDSSLWWVIAAANGIGYAMQIKEGRELIVPTNLEQIAIII